MIFPVHCFLRPPPPPPPPPPRHNLNGWFYFYAQYFEVLNDTVRACHFVKTNPITQKEIHLLSTHRTPVHHFHPYNHQHHRIALRNICICHFHNETGDIRMLRLKFKNMFALQSFSPKQPMVLTMGGLVWVWKLCAPSLSMGNHSLSSFIDFSSYRRFAKEVVFVGCILTLTGSSECSSARQKGKTRIFKFNK